MNIIDAKETLARAHLCDMLPLNACPGKCNECELHVTPVQEIAAVDYLYKMLKERGFNEHS